MINLDVLLRKSKRSSNLLGHCETNLIYVTGKSLHEKIKISDKQNEFLML